MQFRNTDLDTCNICKPYYSFPFVKNKNKTKQRNKQTKQQQIINFQKNIKLLLNTLDLI